MRTAQPLARRLLSLGAKNRPTKRQRKDAQLADQIVQDRTQSGCMTDITYIAMESFWSTLKTETGLDAAISISRRAAELMVFAYIEPFYTPKRRHSSLGYLSPVAFEKQTTKKDITAA